MKKEDIVLFIKNHFHIKSYKQRLYAMSSLNKSIKFVLDIKDKNIVFKNYFYKMVQLKNIRFTNNFFFFVLLRLKRIIYSTYKFLYILLLKPINSLFGFILPIIYQVVIWPTCFSHAGAHSGSLRNE